MDRRVALESTVIAHGLPSPTNLETAFEMEKVVVENGGLPKTVGIIDGEVIVGLSREEIEFIANSKEVLKVGTAEVAFATAMRKTAATTVSATAFLANSYGISVFATGGIGGVHRGIDWDVSQDILELSRTGIIVVSAGVKSILDVSRTLEFLETFQVTVLGYQTDRFPVFHCRESPYRLNLRVDHPEDVVAVLREKKRLGIKGGVLVANPIPLKDSIDYDELQKLIEVALEAAKEKGINGKALTPYLLSRLARISDGETLRANISLLINNAALGGKIGAIVERAFQ